MTTLVDTNVFIDLLGLPDALHRNWSVGALKNAEASGPIILSAIVWSELAAGSMREDELRESLARLTPRQEDFPFAAAFPAGQAHRRYRERGGRRDRPLPDFLIGAHALVAGHRLLTRDASHYREYFPTLDIVCPETHP